MLFADVAAFVAHTEKKLQRLLDQLSKACNYFGLISSLRKTTIRHLGSEAMPAKTIKDYTLEIISQFTYVGSTVSDNATLNRELGKRIAAATNMAKLTSRV